MPVRYGKRKATARPRPKRRVYRRRRPRGIRPNSVVSRSSPVPDRFFTRLNYTELITMQYTGTLKTYQFRVNCLNDPNYTATGHQPMGHDQFALLYNKYKVHGCKYTIIFSNTNVNYQGEAIVQLRPNSVLSASFEDAMEAPYKQYRVLGAEGSGPNAITGYASVAKVFGVKKSEVSASKDFQANVGSDPTNQIYLNIYTQNQATATALDIQVRVNLTFYCEFYERKVLGSS